MSDDELVAYIVERIATTTPRVRNTNLERKARALVLYGQGYSYARIGEALGVSATMAGRDVKNAAFRLRRYHSDRSFDRQDAARQQLIEDLPLRIAYFVFPWLMEDLD